MGKQKQYGLSEARKFKIPLSVVISLLIFLVFFQAVTQHLAHQAGYHPALGEPVYGYFYWPWSAIAWKSLFGRNAYFEALQLGLIAAVLPLAVAVYTTRKLKKKTGIADLHGSARWATLAEIKAMGLLNGAGVYIGGFYDAAKKVTRYLRDNGLAHILVFAPTRAGKGVCLVITTLLAWAGSVFCLDIKGENWGITAWFRKYILGHKVFRLDLGDHSGKGARFNPLQEIRLDSLNAIKDAQNMGTSLVDPLGKGLDDYWTAAAFNFVCSSLMHVCVKILHEQKRYANLTDLCLALSNPDGNIDEFYDEMLESDHAAWISELFPDMPEQHGQDIHIFVASGAQEMKSKGDKERGGVLNSVTSKLGLYRDPVVRMNMEASDFTISDLMNHDVPIDVYLVTPPSDIQRFTPFNRLILSLVAGRLTEEMKFVDGKPVANYKHRLLLLLDEFTAPGKIQAIEKAIAFCAGYGIKLMIFVQDIDQLNGTYGKDNGIIGNCHIRIAYAPTNQATCDLLSKMTGTTTVVQTKDSISGSGSKKSKSESVQETSRPLLTPDECSRIQGIYTDSKGETQPGDMLIFVAGQNPVYGKQILYFKDPTFMERVKGAPERSDRLDTVLPFPVVDPDVTTPAAPATSPDPENTSKRNTFADFLNS